VSAVIVHRCRACRDPLAVIDPDADRTHPRLTARIITTSIQQHACPCTCTPADDGAPCWGCGIPNGGHRWCCHGCYQATLNDLHNPPRRTHA